MSIAKTCLAVDFEGLLAMKNNSITTILEMLEGSGLRKFISCGTVFNIPIIKQFFATAKLEHGVIVCTVNGKECMISQSFFSKTLELPSHGLNKVSDITDGNHAMWAEGFSITGSPISIPTEKHNLKTEFKILATIVAKILLARAGAYDKITTEEVPVHGNHCLQDKYQLVRCEDPGANSIS